MLVLQEHTEEEVEPDHSVAASLAALGESRAEDMPAKAPRIEAQRDTR